MFKLQIYSENVSSSVKTKNIYSYSEMVELHYQHFSGQNITFRFYLDSAQLFVQLSVLTLMLGCIQLLTRYCIFCYQTFNFISTKTIQIDVTWKIIIQGHQLRGALNYQFVNMVKIATGKIECILKNTNTQMKVHNASNRIICYR